MNDSRNPLYERSKICEYCGQLLPSLPFLTDPPCINSECRSHLYVSGNKVFHRAKPELGVGVIQKFRLKSKKISFNPYLQYQKVPKKRSKKSSRPHHVSQEGSQVKEYFILFEAYFEKWLPAFSLKHHIFEIDSRVRFIYSKKKRIGTILAQNLIDPSDLIQYKIMDGQGKQTWVPETDILNKILSPINEFFKRGVDLPSSFILKMWGAQLNHLYSSNLLKIVTNSRLSLLPHQISVAHKLLNLGMARYILADEVGLGKTIEAGIFIKEMMAQKLASRILIITPASITGQWEFELNNKFNLKFTRLTSKLVKKLRINYQTGCFFNQDTGEDLTLFTATLQYARLEQCADLLPKIEWDIIVFDEAHHLRRYLTNQKTELYRSTLAYDLAQVLALKTKSFLLLTATPIQLHSFDLYSLIQLLNPYAFPTFDSFEQARKGLTTLNVILRNLKKFTRINKYERESLTYQIHNFLPSYSVDKLNEILPFKEHRSGLLKLLEKKHFLSDYVIRNRRRIVFPNSPVKRIPQIVQVVMQPEELDLYNRIHLYLAKIYSQNFDKSNTGLGFIMVVLQKLLTSSPPALIRSLSNRIRYLEENKETILNLGGESENDREFTEDESSLDIGWGLEDFDLEDRKIIKKRNQKMKEKREEPLDFNAHLKILREFRDELAASKFDSKAEYLMATVGSILQNHPEEKILLFTQFKQTLFYLEQKLKECGYIVAPFHGGLTEPQKEQAIANFKSSAQILLSTEIGGEGRNFQFCHIIINYDLPWNPMRLEQRIGRLDRIGQTRNVNIYNFYIQDTVESSIISAITDRIHLFEESIGALEPILGSLEKEITRLVLKKDEVPMKFRVDELISSTSDKIEEIHDQLEDFILDKTSFQYDYISDDISRTELFSGRDMLTFLKSFVRFMNLPINRKNFQLDQSPITISSQTHENGSMDVNSLNLWRINLSHRFRSMLRLPNVSYSGVFDLDYAMSHEEYDLYALGHPVLMKSIDFILSSEFLGGSSILFLDGNKWQHCFKKPYSIRLPEFESKILASFAKNQQCLNLFLYEVEFLGIIIEKKILPVVVTDDQIILPTLSAFLSHPGDMGDLLLPANFSLKEVKFYNNRSEMVITDLQGSQIRIPSQISQEIVENSHKVALQFIKTRIGTRIKELGTLNQTRYAQKMESITKSMNHKKRYIETQLSYVNNKLNSLKPKLPTQRQLDNLEGIMNPMRKKKRIEYFENIKKDIRYYTNESKRWDRLLEEQEFDIPAQRKKLKKYSKLLVNAKFIGYSRLFSLSD